MIKLVASDIDGTLTEKRGSLRLAVESIKAIRLLEENNIRVSLVSGNSLPITAGLARYIGAGGPAIGENGCLILYKGKIIHLCKGRPPNELVEKILNLGFVESWQNIFRLHDLAFLAKDQKHLTENIDKVASIVEAYGFKLLDSGYAIHIQPPGAGKARGVLKALELLNIEEKELAVIGDGKNDRDMFINEAFKACPSDADPSIKNIADYIASEPGGRGVLEIANVIVKMNKESLRKT